MDVLLERRWLVSSLFAAGLLCCWQVAGTLGALPVYVLAPSAIVAAVGTSISDGSLLPASGDSLLRQFSGFVLGSSIGVAIGLLTGVNRWAEDIFDTLVSLTYPLPKIALFPVAVLWLGYTDTARILVIAVSCFFPSFINALAGTRNLDSRLLWVARNAGASRLRVFCQVVLRAAMPSVVNGVRLSLALSFILTFATESIGASEGGLGAMISVGFDNLVYSMLWVGIVAFGVYGFVADQLWTWIAGRLMQGQRVEAVGRG